MRQVGRALRHRNYRLFFFGQGLSLIGTWLTKFAMSYATWHLSRSELQLGLVAFFSQAPTAAIAPFAGVLVDRWDRRRVVILTQVAALLQSAALAFFALSETMTVWHLLVLATVQAVINGFDMPARQSFVRQMVDDRADLPNAIALNSTLVNSARLIGPLVAAVLVDLVGIGWCFTLDALSYVAVVGSLLAMRVAPQERRVVTTRVLTDLKEGLLYVRGFARVRSLLLLLAATSICGGAYQAMLPAIADDTLASAGPHALGYLMAAAGAGALCGALYLAARPSVEGLERVLARCALGAGLALVAFEGATTLALALPVLFVVGLTLMVQWAATNTLVQTLVDEDKIGRAMSLYAVVFFAGTPIGALLHGALASAIGPVHVFALGGLGCVAVALWFRSRIGYAR